MVVALLMLAGGTAAGAFGSLLGLGGGILIVPLLTLGFGRSLREAVAVSLVCVIATSSAAAGAYLRTRVVNLRLGVVLALFTAVGALVGGLVAFVLPDRVLAGLFALMLAYVTVTMARKREPVASPAPPGPPAPAEGQPRVDVASTGPRSALVAATAALDGPDYRVHGLIPASFASVGAGVLSALLGNGGGVINVPTMHLAMGVPLRVATATSNLMIGVTAVASAVIYLLRDAINPFLVGPTAVGVFIGATIGSRIAHRVDARVLRWLFVVVLAWTALQMARRAIGI